MCRNRVIIGERLVYAWPRQRAAPGMMAGLGVKQVQGDMEHQAVGTAKGEVTQ